MKGIVAHSLGLGVVLAATTVSLFAGEAPKGKTAGIPLVTDWTHQHVVFSEPRTPEQAARLQNDIRYQQQVLRHATRPVLSPRVDQAARRWFWRLQRAKKKKGLHRDWAASLGVGGTAGEGNFPAKYSFSNTVATCAGNPNPDFIVYPTNVAPSGTAASIVAFYNLYNGCPTNPIPGNYWAFNTGATVNTSPVLSFDGTQIAFTQTTGSSASLVLLRWAAGGTPGSPVTPTSESNATYLGCTAPCMTTFSLGANDTNSSVFYDYGSDTAFVGDDSGKLHKYTNVFKGTPAEATTGGWPVTVSGNKLTDSLYDASSTDAFVADNGGFLYRIDGAGNVTASGKLDVTLGITGGPVVDSLIAKVYAYASNDGKGTAGVYQLSTAFASGDTGTETTIGTSTTGTTPVYIGAFDHSYIYSSNSTGNLYVCGNPGGNPTLYQIPITAGVMGAAVAGPVLSGTSKTKCSPVLDVYNPTVTGQGLPEEFAYASVQANGTPSPCGGVSCILSFRTSSWQPNTTYNAGQIVLDSNMNIQVADNSGQISGATPPTWGTTIFAQTSDGGVHWLCQGKLTGPSPASWQASHTYAGNFEILDTNGNIEVNRTAGATSGTTQPTWPTAEGAQTTDGGITWYNLGANPVAALQEPGGTSGIVMDNTAALGSQVYFSNLSGNSCSPSGNGGCAVQASQQGLN